MIVNTVSVIYRTKSRTESNRIESTTETPRYQVHIDGIRKSWQHHSPNLKSIRFKGAYRVLTLYVLALKSKFDSIQFNSPKIAKRFDGAVLLTRSDTCQMHMTVGYSCEITVTKCDKKEMRGERERERMRDKRREAKKHIHIRFW